MSAPIRVLIVEDREDDADLVAIELRRGGFRPTILRVETAEAMNAALEQPWDVVISDWSMPRFSAMNAYATLREKGLDLPFIIVSGTVGEETAVAAMKIGVHDFMTKGHLSRLVPAIERERREFETRRQSRNMREQLVISERMASVGTLAAGVAHEINNPLTTLIGNVEFVTETLTRLDEQVRGHRPTEAACARAREAPAWPAERLAEARDSLAMIQEAAERMRRVVYDLRVFSHPGDDKHQVPVDLRAVLESSLRMASTEIRHRARLVRDYHEVAPVDGSESRLGQIFLNLIVNAAQAIPEGRVAEHEIGIALRMAGAEKVTVEIRDTGAGIPPDILPHIFDPFFTTKPSGVGTGLGLAICHRLVTALAGEISVESTIGKGTVFRIAFPAARPVELPVAESVPPRPPARARASILVIDDEPALRKTVHRMLQKDHDVSVVGTAMEALQMIIGGARFDLILCDLMMPDMTGMDLHAELQRRVADQAAKMAFVTGGAFTDGARAFLERMPDAVIEKPFTSVRIQKFVQDLLH